MKPLSQGDVLRDESNGTVYLFTQFDTLGRIVVWEVGGHIKVLHPIPRRLWRYEAKDLVTTILRYTGKVTTQ